MNSSEHKGGWFLIVKESEGVGVYAKGKFSNSEQFPAEEHMVFALES